MYVGVDGVANQGMDSTHALALKKTAIKNFYVARVPYSVLSSCSSKPCRDVYVTIRGATTDKVVATNRYKRPWSSFTLVGHASSFKSQARVSLATAR